MIMISSHLSILVAGSDTSRQDALYSLCAGRGWNCHIATDPREFRQLIEQGTFDLVIADADMPGLNYRTLLGEACRRKTSQLLLVVSDSHDGEADLRLLRGAETDLMTHPFDLSWVERCMEQAENSKRQESREQMAYSFVVNERTEMRFSCRQLSEAQAISLPIVARLVASRRISETDALKLRLAIQEALLNAFEHGNLELDSRWKEERFGDTDKFSAIRQERLDDPVFADRVVSVISWFDGDAVEIVVKDQGQGFDPEKLKNYRNNLSCFGRGLTLMSSAVDEVRYGCGGTEVTLVKRLTNGRSV
jgi:anti-sigma regulatory factor (Ser/Thr protein kinase)